MSALARLNALAATRPLPCKALDLIERALSAAEEAAEIADDKGRDAARTFRRRRAIARDWTFLTGARP